MSYFRMVQPQTTSLETHARLRFLEGGQGEPSEEFPPSSPRGEDFGLPRLRLGKENSPELGRRISRGRKLDRGVAPEDEEVGFVGVAKVAGCVALALKPGEEAGAWLR